jgi:hypothetical protein
MKATKITLFNIKIQYTNPCFADNTNKGGIEEQINYTNQ